MKRLLPLLILFMFTFVACDNRPKDVLSRSKMEDVLYDYHLMQGIIEQLPRDEKQKKAQDYINAVFEKHSITEAEFDSSIVYYNRHTKDLHKIYEHLTDRYTAANEELQIMNGNNDMMAIFSTGGDTTNLWNSTKLLVLRNKELLNKESFTLHADTSFRRHDQFILTFTPVFMKDAQENYDISLSIGLGIHYANGKQVGITRLITNNGIQQFTLRANDEEDIKSITGFFYYKGKKSTRNLCLIDNISLVRMHEKEEVPEEKADSTVTDSVVTDTVPEPIERRLTPEELRQLNKSGEHINIQKAPSVRTPNSIGPRRRNPKRR
ncbi:MAG: DUF4296 domain-containing protein [Bacteroidaceae bacterium]|nr:DUF4296 domain-containing protein [Bacteroidaceae bacterium]